MSSAMRFDTQNTDRLRSLVCREQDSRTQHVDTGRSHGVGFKKWNVLAGSCMNHDIERLRFKDGIEQDAVSNVTHNEVRRQLRRFRVKIPLKLRQPAFCVVQQ